MEPEMDLMEEREMLVGADPGTRTSEEQVNPQHPATRSAASGSAWDHGKTGAKEEEAQMVNPWQPIRGAMGAPAKKTQASCQDDLSIQPIQGALLRPRQRNRQHESARPWKSLPATPTGELEKDTPVYFSSLTSLQAEEFFDMVAKVQARRLNDQRADFAEPEDASEENPGVSEDQLYDTILAHQSQRIEDQRTEPPIPVGIQGLLDLLLRAQGARMEDQRSALPPGLAAPSLLAGQPSFLHSV